MGDLCLPFPGGADTLNGWRLCGHLVSVRSMDVHGPSPRRQGFLVSAVGWQSWCAYVAARLSRRTRLAIAVSACLHLGAVAVLALVELDRQPMRAAPVVEAGLDDFPLAAVPIHPVTTTLEPAALSGEGGSSVHSTDLVLATGGATVQPGLAQRIDAGLSGGVPVGSGMRLTEPVAPLGGSGAGAGSSSFGSGDGRGIGHGSGDGIGASFFGVTAPGRSFVFVVDASSSMRRPTAGPERTLFNRLKLEILRSVSQMTPEQKFYIIFFSDTFLPMPAPALVAATPEAQSQYLRWMAQVKAGGQTNPEDALRLALQLQPDVVYFLTDGEFPRGVVRRICDMNRGRVVIHTVSYGSSEKNNVSLRQIAEQSGGVFHFVPADEATHETGLTSDGDPGSAAETSTSGLP